MFRSQKKLKMFKCRLHMNLLYKISSNIIRIIDMRDSCNVKKFVCQIQVAIEKTEHIQQETTLLGKRGKSIISDSRGHKYIKPLSDFRMQIYGKGRNYYESFECLYSAFDINFM